MYAYESSFLAAKSEINCLESSLFYDGLGLLDEPAMEGLNISDMWDKVWKGICAFCESIKSAITKFFNFIASLQNTRVHTKAIGAVTGTLHDSQQKIEYFLNVLKKIIDTKDTDELNAIYDDTNGLSDVLQKVFDDLTTTVNKLILQNNDKKNDYEKWEKGKLNALRDIPDTLKKEMSIIYNNAISHKGAGDSFDNARIIGCCIRITQGISIITENTMKLIDQCIWSTSNTKIDIEPMEVQIEI